MSNKYDNIFNQDFYPTPNEVLDMMQIDCRGLKVLEPSAGKGNIIDYLKDNGAKEIFYCEINKDLAKVCDNKAKFLKSNFLEVRAEQISHIQLIVMNPPFSEWKKHIEHAYNIAPDGCTIISLCNTDSIKYIAKNSEIGNVIKNHSNIYDFGQVFKTAERQTNVEISCIHIFKPNYNNESTFEGFYMEVEEDINIEQGLISYDEIQAYVNSYMGALKTFDKVIDISNELHSTCSIFGLKNQLSYSVVYGEHITSKDMFAKELQRVAWKKIFAKMNMDKYLTKGVIANINKFIENQTNVPFTRRNIFKMIEIIIGTKEQSFNTALVEAIDNFTKYTDENRYGVEGWKTNSGHLLNKKFIIPYAVTTKFGGGMGSAYNSNLERLDDLIKVLCNITGNNYSNYENTHEFFYQYKIKNKTGKVLDYSQNIDSISRKHQENTDNIFENIPKTFGEWYDFGFFEIKGFKKGTMHLKFKDENVWWLLNKRYGEIKGFTLPEKFTK